MAWAKVEQPEPVNFTDIVSEEISKKLEAKKKTIDSEQETDNENNKEAQVILDNLKSISEDTCENDAIIARMLQMHLNKENDIENGEEKAERLDNPTREILCGSISESETNDTVNRTFSNKTLNDFNLYSNQKPKENKSYKEHKKDLVVIEACRDKYVESVLHKLLTCHLLKSVTGVISNTKRAIVYSALLNRKNPELASLSDVPKECAVKIYKSDIADIKQWDKYDKRDPKFKPKVSKKGSDASEREFDNFKKTEEVNCRDHNGKLYTYFAKAIILKHGALIMSLIGENQKAAPTLNNAVMTKHEWEEAYHLIDGIICRLYKYGSLVHTDLSEHTILWYNRSCYFVSVGQCVDRNDKNASRYMYNACCRLNTFFKKKGVSVSTNQNLFGNIYFWATY